MDKENKKHRTKVTIYGQNYTIVSKEPPEHVKKVAQFVDAKMNELKKRNANLDIARLSVLSAVNIADDYMKLLKIHRKGKEEKDQERTTGDE